MTICCILITLTIFLDGLGYAIFEIKDNKNKLGGISVIVLLILMLVLVNYSIIKFG